VSRYSVAEFRERLAKRAAEPQKTARLEGRGIDKHPYNASGRLGGKAKVKVDLAPLAVGSHRLQLDMPEDALDVDDQIISGGVGLPPHDFTATTRPHEPLASEHVVDFRAASAV
jgi:hypothetical protein